MPALTKKKRVVARKRPSRESHIAKILVGMAVDGMKNLSEEEQIQRMTKFCDALDAQRRPASKAS